jgi:cation transport ATPase
MKAILYLYYKIYKTYKRINEVIKLYRGPHYHANGVVAILLISIPVWISIKLNLWQNKMYWQYILAVLFLSVFFILTFFIEKKIAKQAVTTFRFETKKQSILGVLVINFFLSLYLFCWVHFLYVK